MTGVLLLTLTIGVVLGLAVAALYVAVQGRQKIGEITDDASFPYRIRNWMDDYRSREVKNRMLWKQAEMLFEQMERNRKAADEMWQDIRNGEYDKDQPHKRRQQ